MKVWAAFVAAGALAVAPSGPSGRSPPRRPAQPAAQGDEAYPDPVDVTRVNMLFTVTDKKGRFVTDLTKDDFEVIESKRPQEIQEFAAESDLPLRLAVLIDTSKASATASGSNRKPPASSSTASCIPTWIRPWWSASTPKPSCVAELMGDPEAANAAIRDLRPGGGTAMYDAIYFACRDKLSQDQPMHKFRRAMVIVSDGDDNQSRYTRDQALEMAQKDRRGDLRHLHQHQPRRRPMATRC